MSGIGIDIGGAYAAGQARVMLLARACGEDEQGRTVPGCPAWTVHDLLAHLSGLTGDALAGNMAGAPGDAWTAAQVDARRDWSLSAVLDEWDANVGPFVAQLAAAGERAPTSVVMDITTHEQDLRGALGLSRMTDRLVLDWGVPRLVKGYGARLGAAGLPSVVVRVDGVEHAAGELAEGEASPLRLDVPAFDLFRAALGRRSLAQLGRLDWSGGDPGPVIPLLALFPPAERDIVE